ncbi:MAG: nitrogen regulation protein NR(II) [Gammaproteobacteria bacterium]|nr:nitrogen regulation protein NR(II) [Gammaproteobacteria bacterium]
MLEDAFKILQQQSTSIALLDGDLTVVYLNESAESLLNTSLRRAGGQPLTRLVRGGKQLSDACRRILREGGQIRLRNHELLLFSTTMEKHMDCVINRMDDGHGGRLILEMTEIEPSGKLVRDAEFLRRQQSNQAVIRGVAHEIRNPLGGIRGAAQLLAEEAGSEAFSEYTGIIIQEADRLTDLVNRMQASTRADLDEQVNIHRVVEHVRQLLNAEVEGSYRLLQDYDPSLPRVRGNRDLLIQALLNVMRNAVEALEGQPGERRIVVRTRIDYMALAGCRRQVVRVEVVDNGPGVDPDIESRIFDPMVTGKADGTGLGLPIAAEIITQHGGALDFASKPGETAFRLFLPVDGALQH